MKFKRLTCVMAMSLLGALGLPHQGSAQGLSITPFDAPGAGTAAGQGTQGIAISPTAAIAGQYIDASNVSHGFVRSPSGTFTTFDAPGAGTAHGQGTFPNSINLVGAIAGLYIDGNSVNHGFLRAPDGTFTTFGAPGAGTGVNQGTFAANINDAGGIAGYIIDASNVFHGFVRAPDGTFTPFDAPGAGTGARQGTRTAGVDGLTDGGAITGTYIDPNSVSHAYVRAADGSFTTFDVPGSLFTGTAGINAAGATTGGYRDANNALHGFLRAPDGTISTFDVPGAALQGIFVQNINAAEAIVGFYVDASNVLHGFLRAPDGTLTTFNVPGAGTGSGQGTIPISNNDAGAITGFYTDASGVVHGFIGTQLAASAAFTSTFNLGSLNVADSSVPPNFFTGPFNYGFTTLGLDPAVAGQVTINSITVSADATLNHLPFYGSSPFDWEIFIGPAPFGFTPGQISGTAVRPDSIASNAPTQLRFAQLAGATIGGTTTLTGTYDFVSNTFQTNTVNNLKFAGTSPGDFPNGLYVQVFLWTEGGDQINLDFSNIKVTVDGTVVTPVLKITPPPSVQLNALESNQNAFFFAERVSFVLPSPIAVDATLPGTYDSNGSLTAGIIPAGTVVDSYFLHADPFDPNNGVFYSGSVSFTNPILGVIALSGSLDQTDTILGAPATLYPVPESEPVRGFELGFPDMFVISPDGKTLTFSNAAGGADDQLRIVTAASPPQAVAPGTSTTFTSPNVINQTVTIPPDANMNGTATMRVSFIQVAPAVFNASIANGTNGNAFSGGTPVPAGTTCTPINGAGGNCLITENKCFRADGTAFDLCPITATTTPIQLTSQYETSSLQPNPAMLIASDGQSNYAVITTGFNAADPTISGGTKALNSDEVIANLPGSLPTDTVPPTTTAVTSPVAPNGTNGWFTISPVNVILTATDDTLVKQITFSTTGGQMIAPTMAAGAATLFPIANQGVTTISYQATDQAGNLEPLKMLILKIDTTPPNINISMPPNGATYTLNQGVAAGYTCTDPIPNGVNVVSGLASCTGPVGNGSNIDTASVGNKKFTVNSTDNAGNQSTQTDNYTVSYNVCILYNPALGVQPGAVIPLKMYLCDARGTDVSSSGVVVHATKLIQVSTQASEPIATPGNANPGNNFRFDSTLGPSGGYIFNLLANLPTGTYELFFTAGNDPSTTHFLTFQVK